MFTELAGEMHRAERVLKAAMLGRRIDPARALQLIDVPQALHPGRIDDRLLGYFALVERNGELDVMMDRVGEQCGAFVLAVRRGGHLKAPGSPARSTGCRSSPCAPAA